jgi:L-asparaginase
MAMTAFFLSMIFPSSEPIVLTGSMRPSDAIGADGPANLKDAITLARSESAKGWGVLMLLNQKIYAPRHVVKMNPQTVEAFVDLHGGAVGEMTKDGPYFYHQAPETLLKDIPLTTFFREGETAPKVGILYQYPDADPSLVKDMIKNGYKGIVLAGVGHGNVSDDTWPLLEEAHKKGILIVRSSQAQGGIVSRNGEINDDEKGFIASLDLEPQKARILTQLALMAGYTTPEQVQPLFSARSPFSQK